MLLSELLKLSKICLVQISSVSSSMQLDTCNLELKEISLQQYEEG